MGSFNGVGIGLSIVFGCIFMAFVGAELYYLLWWKKKIPNNGEEIVLKQNPFLFCWKKKPISFNRSISEDPQATINGGREDGEDLETGGGNGDGGDSALKGGGYGEEGVEAELIRLHNLCGPPRFLFTIKEENKEDLESEDGKSKPASLGDLITGTDETPFFTPLTSPTNMSFRSLDSFYIGFNPIFESMSEFELNRLRSSPPPTFKFLKDAEDKFLKRLMEESEEKQRASDQDFFMIKDSQDSEKDDDSLVSSCIEKGFLRSQICYQASQVLPLASSPTPEQNCYVK